MFVLGGTRIFEDALPRAQRIHLTRVHATVEGDTLFPGFSQDAWTRTAAERHEVDERHRHAFTFETWERSEA